MLARLAVFDAKCYGVNVAKEIKYNHPEIFYIYIYLNIMENKAEKYKYCVNRIIKWVFLAYILNKGCITCL